MPWVNSADLRGTHDKNQRVFTFGRRLEDVVTDLRRGIFLLSELCMIRKSIGEASGTHAPIEGSAVSERRL